MGLYQKFQNGSPPCGCPLGQGLCPCRHLRGDPARRRGQDASELTRSFCSHPPVLCPTYDDRFVDAARDHKVPSDPKRPVAPSDLPPLGMAVEQDQRAFAFQMPHHLARSVIGRYMQSHAMWSGQTLSLTISNLSFALMSIFETSSPPFCTACRTPFFCL